VSRPPRDPDQGALFPELVPAEPAGGRGGRRLPSPTATPVDVGHGLELPRLVADAGDEVLAAARDWLTGEIRNKNTRAAYRRSVAMFFGFLETLDVEDLAEVATPHVALWVELLERDHQLADTTRRLRLAGVRSLFQYLVARGVVATDPTAAVQGPKVDPEDGRTPWLSEGQGHRLLEVLAADRSLKGVRDLALVSMSLTTLLRADAVLQAQLGDLVDVGDRVLLRAREKGGQVRTVELVESTVVHLKAWTTAAGLVEPGAMLWPSFRGRGQEMSGEALTRRGYLHLLRKRAGELGLAPGAVTVHTLRRTGAMSYLRNGGNVRELQAMLGHRSLRTTAAYLGDLEAPAAGAYRRILSGDTA
jgi:integrase/recombinase XerD